MGSEAGSSAGSGFSPVGIVAAVLVAAAFYAPYWYLGHVAERIRDGRLPAWGRHVLWLSIVAFVVIAVVTAFLAPAAFGGVILGGCVGITIAFQVRRPLRPPPSPGRPAPGPRRGDPPDG